MSAGRLPELKPRAPSRPPCFSRGEDRSGGGISRDHPPEPAASAKTSSMESDGCAKLYAALALSGLFFVAEIIASHVTHSLVLLIYAYQMLYNVLALVLLVISHHICQERTLKNTFGWARVEVLGTLVNMLFLMALCFAISVAAVQTIVHASHENTEPHYPMLLLCFGIVGLSVDIVCYLVIGGSKSRRGCNLGIVSGTDVQFNFVVGGDSSSGEETPLPCQLVPDDVSPKQLEALLPQQQAVDTAHPGYLGWRECLLEALRTCGGCLMVVGCACAVHFGDGVLPRYVDPVLALVAVVILICTSYPRMKESGLILLQNIPNNMNIHTMQEKLLEKFPTILNVHEFHLWQLTNTQVIATVHIVVGSHAVYIAIADKVNRFFHEQGISSTTVQPEFCQATHTNSQCILRCSQAKNCGPMTCCGKHANDDDDSELRHRKVANQQSGVTQSLLSVPISNTTRASSVINIDSEVLSELGVLKETDL